MNPRFVFLICSERCGSNLTRAMFRHHPDVVAPAPLHLGRNIGRNLNAVYGAGDSASPWSIIEKELWRRVRNFYGEDVAERVVAQLGELKPRGLRAIIEGVIATVEGYSEDGSGEKQAPKVVFMKENQIYEQFFFLRDVFPEAKFVFQVRDPRDYVASAKKLRKRLLGNKFGSLRNAMSVWRDDQLGGLRLLGHLGPERVFVQRYEDLIKQPEVVLGKLCEFLDLPYDDGMLEFHQEDNTKKMANRGKQWRNLQKPVMGDNAGKYKSVLSKLERKSIEHHLGDLMARFGYQRDFARGAGTLAKVWPFVLEPFERFSNRRFEIDYEIQKFDRDLQSEAERVPLSYPLDGEVE